MKVKFHKLDKSTRHYWVFRRKGEGILMIFIGALWAMQIAGWFSMMPYDEYFVPAVLFVAGLIEIIRAWQHE